MKHSELYAAHAHPGLATPPACWGELQHMWTRPDLVPVDGVMAKHEVALYLCLQCGRSVCFDETTKRIRNEYQAVSPVSEAAAELRATIAAEAGQGGVS